MKSKIKKTKTESDRATPRIKVPFTHEQLTRFRELAGDIPLTKWIVSTLEEATR